MIDAGSVALKALARHAPAGVVAWLRALGEAAGPRREEVLNLATSLAAMGSGLEAAYRRAGSEVRDLVWGMHAGLRGEVKSLPAALDPAAAAEINWLVTRCRRADPEAHDLRRAAMLWIDTASERLTMRAYHREGQRARQARVLLAGPLAALGVIAPLAPPPSSAPPIFERMLRFYDLLAAERLSPQGYNLIAPAQGGFGGFYGMVDSTAGVTVGEIQAAAAGLLAEMESDPAIPLGDPVHDAVAPVIEASIRRALARRSEGGPWPDEFLPSGQARKGFMARLFGGR